jgi:hypothetical protein
VLARRESDEIEHSPLNSVSLLSGNRMGTQPDPQQANSIAQAQTTTSTGNDNNQKDDKEEHAQFDQAEKQVRPP